MVPNNPAQVLTDIQGCHLQPVSWVIPTGAELDHAADNNGTGPQWVASIVDTLGTQPACAGETYWKNTAILITWDDWGGWYDHVKPFQVVAPPAWGAGYAYGFRVPLLVVSAYTAPHTVSNATNDFGSILYFVEKNFGFGFIGPGDTVYSHYADYQAAARGSDLSEFFNLTAPRSFTSIAAALPPSHFLTDPPSNVGPDNE